MAKFCNIRIKKQKKEKYYDILAIYLMKKQQLDKEKGGA